MRQKRTGRALVWPMLALLTLGGGRAWTQAAAPPPTPAAQNPDRKSSPAHQQAAQAGTQGAAQPQPHTAGAATSQGQVQASGTTAPESAKASAEGVLVDQVIGIVNGDLILESDVDEERRFAAFQPYRDPGGKFSRDQAIERLIDRTLILQQSRLQPDNSVTREEAQAQLATLRKDIPACRTYHCETEEGWARFVSAQGFTQKELVERWRQRMEILKFIEVRFRMGVRITPAEIKAYYDKTLLPEYAKQGATAPKLEAISDRIQEVLLQQQVSNLLGDWLKSLKAQGNVRMMRPGEVQP